MGLKRGESVPGDLNGRTSQVPLTEAEKAARRQQNLPDRDQETRPLSALEVVIGYRRLVLLGDPGGGKSTLAHV